MIKFYLLSHGACIGLSIGAALCVIAQSINLIFNLNRYHTDKIQLIKNISEGFILCHILLLSYLIAYVQNSMREDLIAVPEADLFRYSVFVFILITRLIICAKEKRPGSLLIAAAAFITLPVAEFAAEGMFVIIFGSMLLFWFVRSAVSAFSVYRKVKTDISELSIKEAIDALHTGILFCEKDGYILLINKQMQELMLHLTGQAQRNGIQFYNELKAGSEQSEPDGGAVYMLDDQSVWLFREYEMDINNKKYYQISASPVTRQWSATRQLAEQNKQLEQRSAELKETIANLKSIYMNEEALQIKSHIHDILGQRIAVILRMLRKAEIPDKALLRKFAENLPEDLKQAKTEYSAEQEIKIMAQMFGGIGVDLALYGELPMDNELAKFFVTIITESITNAVRHGFATEIEITCTNNELEWVLEISNMGILPDSPITEGGGISNIRRKLSAMGGKLDLKIDSKFLMMATIPKGA